MPLRLTPHERGFYPLFTRAAENIEAAADAFETVANTVQSIAVKEA